MQYWSLRQLYEEKSGYKEAVVDFSEAIRLKPDYVQAYYDRGFWRTRFAGDGGLVNFPPDVIKQYQKDAITDLTKVIQLRPTFAAAYYLRAKARDYPKFDEQGAKKDFFQVIRLDPNLFDTYPDRGDLVKLELRDNQAVLRTLTQTIQKNSKNADVLYQRGFVRLDVGDVKGSIEDFSQMIQLKNNDKDAYYGRGFAYYRLKDYRAAIKDLSQAIQLNPTFADAYLLRALAYLGAGDYQSSTKDSTYAISLDPDSGNTHFVQGLAYEKLGQHQNAAKDYEYASYWPCITCGGASGVESNNPIVYYDRGIALARRGDAQGAVNSLKKAAHIFQTQGNQTLYQETLERIAELQK